MDSQQQQEDFLDVRLTILNDNFNSKREICLKTLWKLFLNAAFRVSTLAKIV